MTPLEQYERKVSQSDLWAPEAGREGAGLLGLQGEHVGGLDSLVSEGRRA